MRYIFYTLILLTLLILSCGNNVEKNFRLFPFFTADFNCNFEGNSRVADILFNETSEILTKRLTSIGISKRNIEIYNNQDIIILIVKSQENIERIKRLVTTQGKLELWETFTKEELIETKQELKKEDLGIIVKEEPTILLSYPVADTAAFNTSHLKTKICEILPRNIKLLWDSRTDSSGQTDLKIIKITNRDGRAPIDERDLESVKIIKDKNSEPKISLRFHERFIQPTQKNYIENKVVAIVVDGNYHSFYSIEGSERDIIMNPKDFDVKDLEIILKSGCLPYKLKIINED